MPVRGRFLLRMSLAGLLAWALAPIAAFPFAMLLPFEALDHQHGILWAFAMFSTVGLGFAIVFCAVVTAFDRPFSARTLLLSSALAFLPVMPCVLLLLLFGAAHVTGILIVAIGGALVVAGALLGRAIALSPASRARA